MEVDAAKIIDSESYKAQQKIKAIIGDDALSDCECFAKIEEIIQVFDELGSGSGRHDFG